jgi:hypothetical protein
VPLLLTDKNGKQAPMVDLTGKFYKMEDLDEKFIKNNVNVEFEIRLCPPHSRSLAANL